MVLVAASSDLYAPHLVVSLHSALRHLDPSRRVDVYVLDGGISADRLLRVESRLEAAHPRVRVMVLKPDPCHLEGLAATERYPAAVYLRMLIPTLLPQTVVRALYIDCDVAVTEDLAPLFDLDLGGQAIGAVRDAGDGRELARLARDFDDVTFGPQAAYFNAGVLLMDLPAWRRAGMSERALGFIRTRGALCKWFDQDALNLAAAGEWCALPEKWNNQIHGFRQVFPRLSKADAAQGILHFAGSRKPWEPGRYRHQETYLEAVLAARWDGTARRMRLIMRLALLRVRTRVRDAVRGGPVDQVVPAE